jgi:hypothetical protein
MDKSSNRVYRIIGPECMDSFLLKRFIKISDSLMKPIYLEVDE